MSRALSLSFLLAAILPALADKPLAEAASGIAGHLPAGGIVTGEWIKGKASFSEHGTSGPAGIAPEKQLFEIGSISKVFTGILLADSVLDGKVRYESTLKELLGGEIAFKDSKVGNITLLQLATHTSGLPRLPGNIGPNPDASDDPYANYDRQLLHAYLAGAVIEGEPPYPAAYSNLGMGLLGDLLSELHGKPWEELVKEKITTPLGMSDTVVTLSEFQEKRLAPPHRGAKEHHSWHFQALAGAGALRSTAADLLVFGKALLAPRNSALAEPTQEAMKTRAPYNDFGAEIGLGIIIGKIDGDPVFEHSGGTGGYRSMLQVIPARETVRVVLINNDAMPAESVVRATRDAPLGNVATVELPAEELDAYVGVYQMGPKAIFTVLRVDDELRIRLTGQPFAPVKPVGDDRFRYQSIAAEIQFKRVDEKVASLTLLQNGRELAARRIDQPVPELQFPAVDEWKELTGEYELSPDQVITVSIKGHTLFAQVTGQPPYPVFQTKPGHFAYDVVDAEIEFERESPATPVTGLVLHQNGEHRAKKRP
ncbi:serine hydrolase [Luteolibacter marinus]|uniref:serine hydrolase n=1 Tax=Luteolibacter marinus TaxID=2776705 RepID=UPI00186851EF|nr:serine hydrolase [Luteolibacter marinus]